ncbi:sensor domain-containing phosphodiesterase [Erwinia oleae]|uniref:sensor domain-containing phosphodiesterase n=1 Tax=Erwinia oleae TaxID=796334 RepID=UPI000691116B|nr:EAL domain-containing protein [Erwinia oleae]
MIINNIFKNFNKSMWGLPLLLPVILMPLSTQLSVRLFLPQGYVYLIYLPLAVMVAMLMVYDWAAFPGIALSLIVYYFQRYQHQLLAAWVVTGIFLATLVICWTGYKLHARKRWSVDFSELRLMPIRLFWLAFMVPTLFSVGMQLMLAVGFVPAQRSIFSREMFSLHTLLNYQSVLLSCMAMMPISYLAIRSLRNPTFIRLIYRRARRQAAHEVKKTEFFTWSSLLIFLMAMLLIFQKGKYNLLTTDYGLPLLLPLMLWSAVRFGYIFTSLSWAVLLLALYQLRDRFLGAATEPYHLAVMSANLLVFTLTILLMAAITTRQRFAMERIKLAALSDPIVGLPNLRALVDDLAAQPRSTLCFLRIPDLDKLSRIYGLQMRIQYKRSLANHLMSELLAGEYVYQLPGFDLVMRLDYVSHLERIENIEARLKDYHLMWEGMPVYTAVGLSYCTVRPPVTHLYQLLGEMSAQAEVSLRSGVAENLHHNRGKTIQRSLTEKIALLEDVQALLETGDITLIAQKICGIRGDAYYAISLQMSDRDGELVPFERFSAIVNEFGLAWEVDRLVIVRTLAFVCENRETLPAARFAISLFTTSLARPRLAKELGEYLSRYHVEPWQLILQVDESSLLRDYSGGNRSVAQLRQLGLRVAINDFGSAWSSYTRLKEVQADMLKIDRQFVDNMHKSSLDYQIIESICAVARLKRMQIIAEGVESEETAQLLRRLGVDFLQGEFISQPCHLATLPFADNQAAESITL